MPAALGPRLVLEAGFLILLAVVVGFADLSPALIILVMAIGWLLVAMIEYFAWRQGPSFATATRYAAPAPQEAVEEEVEEVAPPPPPPPSPAPAAEEETIVEPPGAQEEPEPDKETVAEAEERVAAARRSFTDAEREQRKLHRLEPLQPRPRRRWIIFGPYVRPEAPAEGSSEEEQ
jgi:outer membrane biosynthesis protein TonB